MHNNVFKKLINEWQQQQGSRSQVVETKIPMDQQDLIKLNALADTFNQDREQLIAHLLHLAIKEIESNMPYIAGNKIIRMEEGEAIYEDIGPTPTYLDAQKKHTDRIFKKSA